MPRAWIDKTIMDDFDLYFDDETFEAVRKFEVMKRNRTTCFFDVDEFESIIDFYLDNNNTAKADDATGLAMQQHPNSMSIKLRRARLLLDKGHPIDAMSLIRSIEQFEGDNQEVVIAKGTALCLLGELDEALELFDNALSNQIDTEDKIDLLLAIVSVFESISYYQEAIPYMLQLTELDPDMHESFYDLAYCYERIDDDENSLKYYKKFVELEPLSENGWYGLAFVYSRTENFEKALEAYDYTLAINPQNIYAILYKATIYWSLDRFDEAIDCYSDFLENDPQNCSVMSFVAECYESKGDYEMARKFYNKILKIDSDYIDAWYGLGMLAFDEGRYDKCICYLKVALQKDSEHPNLWNAGRK